MFKYLKSSSSRAAIIILLVIAGMQTGCKKDDEVTAPIPDNFALSMKVDNTVLEKTSADSIRIDTIKILIKDIKIHPLDSNDSVNVKSGPFIVYLYANGTTNTVASTRISAGTYQRVHFEIHKPESGETVADPEFNLGTASDLRSSVIVKGVFNGTPFVYKSKKSATQQLYSYNPVSVSTSGVTNITLLVNTANWFKKSGTLMNPALSANENDIDNNIKDSFKKAIKDNNKDGIEDN